LGKAIDTMKRILKIVPALGLALLFSISVFAENMGILTEVIPLAETGYAVIDVMDGVEARYRSTAHPDYYGEFSCAGFIKSYYEKVYGIFVDNLSDTGPPRGRTISETGVQTREIFMQVDTPQKGDIIFYTRPPHRNNHSAIVKSFDGNLITLIEQNFKWAQAGGTYTWFNRTIPYTYNGNDYQIWRLNYINGTTKPETTPSESIQPDPPSLYEEPEPATDENDFFYIDNNPVIYEFIFNNIVDENETIPVFFEIPEEHLIDDFPPDDFYELDELEHFYANEVVVGIGRPFILINGDPLFIDAYAYIENNRTMLPVRYVGYALGLTAQNLHWDEPTRTVTIFNNFNEIRFTIDSDVLLINGEPQVMDTAALLTDGYAYLPVRFLAEAMDVHFDWDDETATVHFYY
jgi:hypothetical protein